VCPPNAIAQRLPQDYQTVHGRHVHSLTGIGADSSCVAEPTVTPVQDDFRSVEGQYATTRSEWGRPTCPHALRRSQQAASRRSDSAVSQANVDMVIREYAAFAARDWAALAELWHPDIEYEVVKGAGTFRGLDQITQFFSSYSEMYSEFRVEAEEIVDAGEHVVAMERLAARGLKGSNASAWVQDRFARVITFKDGKIWRVKEYATRAEALEAAGLPEQPAI
jgi:ketosteroid isomerase-like protein